jgi:hypothetical protein
VSTSEILWREGKTHFDNFIASAFYGFETVLIPHNLEPKQLGGYLKKAQAQLLIAEAGAVDLTVITTGNAQLKNVIWVAKEGSRHMDWNEVPAEIAGKLKVTVWHELVQAKKVLEDTEIPVYEPKSATPSITALWSSSEEFIEYKPQVSPSNSGFFVIYLRAYWLAEYCIGSWCDSQLATKTTTIESQ